MRGEIVKGYHHTAITVKDFDRSLKFYREVLGLKEVLAWGENDRRAVMLDFGDGGCIEIFAGGTADPKPEGVFLHLALRTDNCDNAIAAVKAAGMEITSHPVDITIPSNPPKPIRIAFFKGPDGEILEFFQEK